MTKHCRESSHSRTKENPWVKKLYVLTEQAGFWLEVEVVCCLPNPFFHKAWWTNKPGEEVDRPPSPNPTKASFVSTNDHWSVNTNSKVELKIYDVQFEIWRGDWPNATSEYRVGISVKCRVLVQISKLIKSSSVFKFVSRVENVQRTRPNKKVEFKS